jgi:hypothetical protein
MYQRWYPLGVKCVPRDLKLTPLMMLMWYVGEASTRKYHISLATHSFCKEDIDFLIIRLREEIGVEATPYPNISKSGEVHYLLDISSIDVAIFLNFLRKAQREYLGLAQQLFPWKFNCSVYKRDVYNPKREFIDEGYLQTFLNLLKQAGINVSDRIEQLHYLFPWIDPLLFET